MQLTAGKGPAECAWAVVQVLAHLRNEANSAGLEARTLELIPGDEAGTAQSALVALTGEGAEAFAGAWRGTVQWIGKSPFRPTHRRKNWFVGIEVLEPVAETRFDSRDVAWETMRASGPGGQHVNRTESAVRVTHLPTGVQASASEERSQHRNRKLALARLAAKLEEEGERKHAEVRQQRWKAHQDLERGNAVRVLRG